ncbi:MAG TPA: hypothetical protein DDW76_38070 [Cyanobacteria bacterium UBA11369]|nr:hypothetical protein [Cyanobacteria bacterium UBA11371]HBE33692.1 hypothetical protein [Cyanobacteria bacterium UBA11368]HBE54404.1 hypothetical protein [Cyanobacteria bacterium UBA11369]
MTEPLQALQNAPGKRFEEIGNFRTPKNDQLPITNYQLPITNYQLTYCFGAGSCCNFLIWNWASLKP